MIDVSNFSRVHFVKNKEFKNILTKIVMCYEMMCNDCVTQKRTLPNNENQLRDILHYEYLNLNQIRAKIKLNQYLFVPEVPEDHRKDNTRGRADLRVIIKSRSFENPQEHFTIECKRLDGNTSLNEAYIVNGILRFVNENPLYSSYYGTNGMLGFVVKDINVANNMHEIDNLLSNKHTEAHVIDNIVCEDSVPCCYKSTHISQNKPLRLYHLMLDISHVVE